MGYTIEYTGRFELNKPLTEEHANFLQDFAKTRHYHRFWSHEEEDGRWFVDPEGNMEPNFNDKEYHDILYARPYDHEKRKTFELEKYGCIDLNEVNPGMPSFYCQWIPTEDREGIEWDGGEKFYNAEKWLRYIIENYLKPWGYVVNGTVEFKYGEPEYNSNTGALHVSNNKVFVEEYEEDVEDGGMTDTSFNYQMLDRMMSDCDYFLGNGNRNPRHLWAITVDGQIRAMKSVWLKLKEKPEWCTWEDILEYERKMKE